MKCPKCGYIGFEQTDRCRNCGYDFELAAPPAPEPDLPLRKADAAPFADFDLGDSVPAGPSRGARRRYDPDLDPRVTPPPGKVAADLPLFDDGAAGDEVAIVPSSTPTPPLAVRRSTPPAVRARPRPTPRFVEPERESRLPLADAPFAPPAAADLAGAEAPVLLPLGGRLLAGLLDWALLLAVDAIVVYFTLKICRLDLSEFRVLPLAPLVAFFVLLDGGYLALLTAAGGQTLGKMAFGLRVVGPGEGAVPVGASITRAMLVLLAALPAGAGLLPIIFTSDRRGLHDVLAGTRVVKA